MSPGASRMRGAAAPANRCVQSKLPAGVSQSMRRRLWTTFPLPTMSTPWSRSGARRAPMSRGRPGAVVETPAVPVEADPAWLDGFGDELGDLGVAGCGVVEGEQLIREAVEVVDH